MRSVVKDHDEPKVAGGHAGRRVDGDLEALELMSTRLLVWPSRDVALGVEA